MTTKSKILTFATALGLALPAVALVSMPSAYAGDVLDSAGKEGKRTHKRVGKAKTKSKKKSSSTNTTRTTTTRTSARPTTTRTTTTTHRTTGTTHRHYTTTRTYVRSHSQPTRTRVVRTSPTHVHHHHHSDTVYVSQAPSAGRSTARSSGGGGSSIDVYITGGVGISGFASTTITDEALPGVGWNVAVGGKGKYLGLEIGLDGGGYTFDPQGTNTTDLGLFGLYGDLRLQPTIAGFFEPFVYAGLGGYVLGDGILQENSSGGAFRLGLGANLRFDDIAIGGKYAWQTMGFTDDSGSYGGDFSGESETVGINLSIYF